MCLKTMHASLFMFLQFIAFQICLSPYRPLQESPIWALYFIAYIVIVNLAIHALQTFNASSA